MNHSSLNTVIFKSIFYGLLSASSINFGMYQQSELITYFQKPNTEIIIPINEFSNSQKTSIKVSEKNNYTRINAEIACEKNIDNSTILNCSLKTEQSKLPFCRFDTRDILTIYKKEPLTQFLVINDKTKIIYNITSCSQPAGSGKITTTFNQNK